MYRCADLPCKVVRIVFRSLHCAFSYNFNIYIISNIFNLYHNVLICPHQHIISWLIETILRFPTMTQAGHDYMTQNVKLVRAAALHIVPQKYIVVYSLCLTLPSLANISQFCINYFCLISNYVGHLIYQTVSSL